MLRTSPLRVLGLYEWMLGSDDPILMDLARTAVLAFGASLLGSILIYPTAYHRVMLAVVQGDGVPRAGRRFALSARLVQVTGRSPRLRAVAQFYLTTLTRSDRHRFLLAVGFGLAAAWSLPALLTLAEPPRHLSIALLSPPLAAIAFIVTALRVAAALPADLKAGWLFEGARPSRLEGHRAVERLMFVIGVLPVLVVFVPFYWWLYGPWVALAHGVTCMGLGALLIELLLWRFDGAVCARAWDVESARLGRLWPAYLGAFLLFTLGMATLSLRFIQRPPAMLAFIACAAGAAVLIRYASLRQPLEPSSVADTVPGELLGLN